MPKDLGTPLFIGELLFASCKRTLQKNLSDDFEVCFFLKKKNVTMPVNVFPVKTEVDYPIMSTNNGNADYEYFPILSPYVLLNLVFLQCGIRTNVLLCNAGSLLCSKKFHK